ncbi:MAG: tetratricopeptide repeat protein [Acidimicrobiales bacterium]
MRLVIRLLGSPSVELDGGALRHLRGHKSWALLAYLLLSERPPSRHELAGLLFSEADDPLGALRWSVAEIRRGLGPAAKLGGDPLRLELSPEVRVDALEIERGRGPTEAGLPGEILERMYFPHCPGFETWLLMARRRVNGLAEAAMVERVHEAIAAGTAAEVTELAASLVEHSPLDEDYQALLVRCLCDSGDHGAAVRQRDAALALFKAELGLEGSELVDEALRPTVTAKRAQQPGGAEVLANIDAGRAAIAAGAMAAALHCLRAAVHDAEDRDDGALVARALTSLGAGLVRVGVSAMDAEITLRRGLVAARAGGDRQSMVVAHRELGFLHVQGGFHVEAETHIQAASELAGDDDSQQSTILGILGMSLSDRARYPEAASVLTEAIARARRCDRHQKAAWAATMLGRVHLLRGEFVEAADLLDEARRVSRSDRWSAFLPWPEILRAEVDFEVGDAGRASEDLQHSHALAVHLGDVGLQALALAGLSRVAARRAEPVVAAQHLAAARSLLSARPRPYVWIQSRVLAAAVAAAPVVGASLAFGRPRNVAVPNSTGVGVGDLLDAWIGLAIRADLREELVRAQLAASALGRSGALEAAQSLAAAIDNPRLSLDVAAARLRWSC